MVFNILNELICKWMGKACHFLIKERGGSCMNNKSFTRGKCYFTVTLLLTSKNAVFSLIINNVTLHP